MFVFKMLRSAKNAAHATAAGLDSIVTYLDGVGYVARSMAIEQAERVADAKMAKAAMRWYRAREAADEAVLHAEELRNDLARVGDEARWDRDEAVRSL
jgi:hypothetical protein